MEKNIEELTLLLMYLTSWNETGYIYDEKSKLPKEKTIKKCWKGYDFNIFVNVNLFCWFLTKNYVGF